MMSIIKPDSWIPIQKKDALDMHWDIYALRYLYIF